MGFFFSFFCTRTSQCILIDFFHMFFCTFMLGSTMNRTALTNTRLTLWYKWNCKATTQYIRWIFVTPSAQLYRYRERNWDTATFESTPWKFRLIKNTFGDRILRREMNEREFRTLYHNSHISFLLTVLQGLHKYTQSA